MRQIRLIIGLSCLFALAAGCAGGDAATQPTEAAATTTPTAPPSEDSETERPQLVESVEGTALPDALLGVYTVEAGDRFTFYPAGDAFCVDDVGTEQSCYSVQLPGEDVAVEQGVAAADGAVLRMMPTVDPKAGCVGTVNELRWKAAAKAVTLEPIQDCHGTQALVLSPAE